LPARRIFVARRFVIDGRILDDGHRVRLTAPAAWLL
jgi:hypothetical protein